MEPVKSQPFRRDTPAPVQTADPSRERVSAYDLMVVDSDLEGLDQEKEQALSLAIDVDLEVSVREQILELEKKKKEEQVEEDTARKTEASIIEPTSALEEIENESDLQQVLDSDVVGLALEMQNEEMVVASQIDAQEKSPCLLQGSRKIDLTEEKQVSAYDLMVVEGDLEGLDQEKDENHNNILDKIQEKASSVLAVEVELKEVSVKEQILELENKEGRVILVEEDRARKTEASGSRCGMKQLLEADVVGLVLKNDEMVVASQLNAQEKLPCLLQDSRKVDLTEEKQVSASSPVQVSEAHEGDIDKVVVLTDDSDDEDTEQQNCVESEFNDFTKTMSSFLVGQVWALYDGIDSMPRWYARIKQVTKSQSRLRVTWLESKDDESVSVPVSCGRFKWGSTETISHLTFSHEMHPTKRGNRFIAVNPSEGETWALFRDWSKSWEKNTEQHKPPYRYDFVEVLHGFDDRLGVGVAYLGKVEGFVSVYKKAKQHGVISFMISPEEMRRFSHRVPSFRMNGEEKEGVPAGSFELDPAAIPSSILSLDQSEETEQESEVFEDQNGSRLDIPIVLD
ncbi:PREDICTED: uncharacterized protein LOC104744640 isoform X1 [Camelina sativa]|uniref:Uncharacterized protein LOC104744640 isoform X1 n=1 Tax=Camelina sativa TaxID=90675 RepID=A0ABM0W0L9_CAMSA|nr:PREDICTED: uncharacterized protein LOC104744640 isoform X1 [Camelina sativa]